MLLKKNPVYDIYYGEWPVNFAGMTGTNKPLVFIIKASGQLLGSRVRSEDSHAFDYSQLCRQNSILRGLYHFLTPNGIAEQAALFLSVWNKCVGADMPPIVDVEVDLPRYYPKIVNGKIVAGESAIGRLVWQGHVKLFLDLISKGTGKTPMIYTSQKYWEFVCTPEIPAWTDDYPLWVAQYPDNPDTWTAPTAMPRGWNKWAIWQYSEKGRSNGFLVNDLNTMSDWYLAEWSNVPEPPVPPVVSVYPDKLLVGAVKDGVTYPSVEYVRK